MTNSELKIGMEVEAGRDEDYAFGTVVSSRYGALSGNTYWAVEWVLGGQGITECLAEQLTPRVTCTTCHESVNFHDKECDPWW